MHRFYVEFTCFLHFLKLISKSELVCEAASRAVCFFENHVKKTQKTKNPEYPLKTKVFCDTIFMYIYEYKGDSL